MEDAKPSRTAMRVAVRRAAHQLLDSPRVLEDPVAVPILGAAAAAELTARVSGQNGRVSRAIRAFIVVRSRFAEDSLRQAMARGARQYVVLGAGLDTFAYRNPFPAEQLHVFEVDHPATQAWKRRKLADAGITIPPSVTYAPVNFESQTLADGLTQAGWGRGTPTFFSWLGVSMYLTEEAIESTLGFIGRTPRDGGLVMDYAVPKSELGLLGRLALANMSRRVAAAGEPFRTFFEPLALRDQLTRLGFHTIEDLGTEELNARYFRDRADGLRVSGGLGRLVAAVI